MTLLFLALATVTDKYPMLFPLKLSHFSLSISSFSSSFSLCIEYHMDQPITNCSLSLFGSHRNSEKRKEKSRNAARERRSQESDIFDQIEELLPVPAKTLEHLDKASLIRLAINYVKTRSLVDFLKGKFHCSLFPSLSTDYIFLSFSNFLLVILVFLLSFTLLSTINRWLSRLSSHYCLCNLRNPLLITVSNSLTLFYTSILSILISIFHINLFTFIVPQAADLFDAEQFSSLQTLEGFVFVISKDGSLAYVSENIERLLGLNSIDLLGHSLYDYSHPCDHADLKAFLEPLQCNNDAFVTSPAGPNYVRMKCTLTSKGRSLNLKSAKYMVSSFGNSFIKILLLITVLLSFFCSSKSSNRPSS